MISSLKYIPLMLATIAFTSSVIFKLLLLNDIRLGLFWRDIVMFFILYFVTNLLIRNIERIMRNYWKML